MIDYLSIAKTKSKHNSFDYSSFYVPYTSFLVAYLAPKVRRMSPDYYGLKAKLRFEIKIIRQKIVVQNYLLNTVFAHIKVRNMKKKS